MNHYHFKLLQYKILYAADNLLWKVYYSDMPLTEGGIFKGLLAEFEAFDKYPTHNKIDMLSVIVKLLNIVDDCTFSNEDDEALRKEISNGLNEIRANIVGKLFSEDCHYASL